MATARLNASCRFSASRRLDRESYVGLRAKTVTISYSRTLTAPHCHLDRRANQDRTLVVKAVAETAEVLKKRYPGEAKGFVEEMRFVAMRMHTRDQAKEGQRESTAPQDGPIATWKFTVEGYLKFLVDNKVVYDTLEEIIRESTAPTYVEFKNTGLERAEKLRMDLEWFKEQGYEIPEPTGPGIAYSQYLKDITANNPLAFICHFYNIYFAQSAGGRMIGTKVSERILNNKELEFYKWDGELSELLQNVRGKLNKVAELWTREEKNHCLEETAKSFEFSSEILRLLLS